MKKIALSLSLLGLITLNSCNKLEKTDLYNKTSFKTDLEELTKTNQITDREKAHVLYYLSKEALLHQDLSGKSYEKLIQDAEVYIEREKMKEEEAQRKVKAKILSRSF